MTKQALTIELKPPSRSTLAQWLAVATIAACTVAVTYPPANATYHRALDTIKTLINE